MNQRQIYIIVGIISFFALYAFLKKRKEANNKISVFRKIREKYGIELAKNVERLFRFETNHFKQGFEGVYGAGMHPIGNTFPWGWGSLRSFWTQNPQYKPIGITKLQEGKGLQKTGGGSKSYLQFPNFLAGAMTIAQTLYLRNNNPGSWFSTQATSQEQYNNAIGKINPSITLQLS